MKNMKDNLKCDSTKVLKELVFTTPEPGKETVSPKDSEPPQGPRPPEGPEAPGTPAGPVSPEEQQSIPAALQEDVCTQKATTYNKNKRKKTSVTDYHKTLQNVMLAMQTETAPPPLIHTPHSMFSMLCDTFEKEFPHSLPQHMRDQCLSIMTRR